MKKTYYLCIAAIAAMGMASCGDKNPSTPDDPTPSKPDGSVEVTISTSAIETKAATLEFGANAKMNIFAKTYNRADAPNIIDGVAATYDGSKWTMSPKVYISESQPNAFVYAVSPYDQANTNVQAIAVDMAKQIDLMYSGAFVPASMTSPSIKLTMKHALSLMSFNIVPVNYSGAGKLQSVKISGEQVYCTGTLDASTGKLTKKDVGTIEGKFDKAVVDGGWKSDIPGVWSMPIDTKGVTTNVTFTIDGKTYDLYLPEVEMKQGFQYIFRLALTNNGLGFDPTKTETISLNVTTDEAQAFHNYSKITLTASGSWLWSPVLAGDAVFGNIATPSAHYSYREGVKVEGISSGNTIVVESWNSTGVEFTTLDGIDTIDFSQFE